MPLTGVFETRGRRGRRRRRVQGEPAARHLRCAGNVRTLSLGTAVRDAAERQIITSASCIANVSRAVQDEHDREHWLARLDGAGPAVRAGARHARSAGRSADAYTTRWCWMATIGEQALRASSAARSGYVERAGRHAGTGTPPRLGEHTTKCWPRRARCGNGDTGRHEQWCYRGPRPRRDADDRPADGAERRSTSTTEQELQRIWADRSKQRPRRPRGGPTGAGDRAFARAPIMKNSGDETWARVLGRGRGRAASAASLLRETLDAAGHRPRRKRRRAGRRL